jgi:hypothetical protein
VYAGALSVSRRNRKERTSCLLQRRRRIGECAKCTEGTCFTPCIGTSSSVLGFCLLRFREKRRFAERRHMFYAFDESGGSKGRTFVTVVVVVEVFFSS